MRKIVPDASKGLQGFLKLRCQPKRKSEPDQSCERKVGARQSGRGQKSRVDKLEKLMLEINLSADHRSEFILTYQRRNEVLGVLGLVCDGSGCLDSFRGE